MAFDGASNVIPAFLTYFATARSKDMNSYLEELEYRDKLSKKMNSNLKELDRDEL